MPKAKNVLLRSKEAYSPEGVKSWELKDLKSEYSRLRNIANNRLSHFTGTEWADSEVYKENFGKFKQLSGIKTTAELRKLTTQVAYFLSAQTSTTTGMKHKRAEAIRTFHEHGYTFVNAKNYKDFTMYMDEMKTRAKGRQYDSERTVELYQMLSAKRKVDAPTIIKDIDFYMERKEELAKLPLKNNGKAWTSIALKKALKKALK